MKQQPLDAPIQGKTYSLFGGDADTAGYYRAVSKVADTLLNRCPDIHRLLSTIHEISGKKRYLKSVVKRSDDTLASLIVRAAHEALVPYTMGVEAHLKSTPACSVSDGIVLTSREQYHLFMLEIELANRAFARDFEAADVKLAFLPHCLRDANAKCRAAFDEIDYSCKGCSARCYINRVSALLRSRDVKPYLWMEADLKPLFKSIKASGKSLGVLGVACVPELVSGMRLCMRAHVPVIGVPLNANRCARWMGKLHPTSVDVRALEAVLLDSSAPDLPAPSIPVPPAGA